MNKKNLLLAVSFDSPTFPVISLDFSKLPAENHILTCKGYDLPGHNVLRTRLQVNPENQAVLWRHEASESFSPTSGILYQAKHLKFFSLNRKIARFSVNNRDWILIIKLLDTKKPCNKTLFPLIETDYPFEKNRVHYERWLLEQISLQKINSLMELAWDNWYELFQKINLENPCTVLLSDGQDLIAYQGSHFSPGFYYLRSCPPHNNHPFFQTGPMHLQLDALDLNHTMIMISNEFIPHQDAKFLNLEQMMVVRSGELVWNKDPQTYIQHEPEKESPQIIQPETLREKNIIQKVCFVALPSTEKSKQSLGISMEWDAEPPTLYSLSHKTVYEYEEPVYQSTHLFRLQPISDTTQSILQYELSVKADGVPIATNAYNFVGAFGNNATFIEIKQPYTRLEVESKGITAVSVLSKKRFQSLHAQMSIPLIWMPWDRIMMQAYLVPPELPESQLRVLSDYALTFVKRNNNDLHDILNDINRTIYEDYTYISGSTSFETTPFDVYTNHKGVCQDFANLFICLARLLNIPARYRTGYIYTAKDYENTAQGDASHAWLEVFLPLIGWTGYDPTNYCRAEENHIRVACGRTYSDTAPTSGTIYRGGGGEKLSINVKIKKLEAIDTKELDITQIKKG